MGGKKVVVEITPLHGENLDLETIQADAEAIFRKYPGVVVNTRVQQEA